MHEFRKEFEIMNKELAIFCVSIVALAIGLSHIYGIGAFASYQERSSGTLCKYIDATLTINEVFIHKNNLSEIGISGCPLYHKI